MWWQTLAAQPSAGISLLTVGLDRAGHRSKRSAGGGGMGGSARARVEDSKPPEFLASLRDVETSFYLPLRSVNLKPESNLDPQIVTPEPTTYLDRPGTLYGAQTPSVST